MIKISSLILSAILVFSLVPIASSSGVIIVPGDYESIGEAIEHASPGDTILLMKGVYRENLVIDKPIHLVGSGKDEVVIDGGRTGKDTILIKADGVSIENVTITGGWSKNEGLWDVSGIRISASDVRIENCVIRDNRLGINVMTGSRNLTIRNNEFFGDGVLLGNYIGTWRMERDDFYHNIENNLVNNKPLVYITDGKDMEISGEVGSIILVNCSGITIKDIAFGLADFPLIIAYCKDCRVENISVVDTDGEIILFHSGSCTLRNIVTKRNLVGICLDTGCSGNTIENCKISNCWMGIEVVGECTNNYIHNNLVYNNYQGIVVGTYYHGWLPRENILKGNKVWRNFIGISLLRNATENLVEKNFIGKSFIGVLIKDSNDNMVVRNTMKRNLLHAVFLKCKKNTWYMNYWGRPRILPKIIPGVGKMGIPWINLDPRPMRWAV